MDSNALVLSRRVLCDRQPILILALTAEERTRSYYRFESEGQKTIFLRLPRGTVLTEGDCLESETGEIVQIKAKEESVLTVKAESSLKLLQAAYHLGNRHVALEITAHYLRLLTDPVLEAMLEQLGVEISHDIVPFFPEIGAYRHSH